MKNIIIKFFKVLVFGFILLFSLESFSQEPTDEEIGFNTEVILKELKANNSFVKKEFLEKYIQELRKEAVLKYELGFTKWLESKKKSGEFKKVEENNYSGRFAGCENFTFKDPINPMFNWTLMNNIGPEFDYVDPYTEQISVEVLGQEYLNDLGGFRFQSLNMSYNDPHLGEVPSNVIRIGNMGAYNRKEMISKSIIINSEDDFISYKFAIVLQDPGPDHGLRPFYDISFRNGEELIDCSVISYTAFSSINGFIDSLNPDASDVLVKPFSTNIFRPADFGFEVGDVLTIEVAVSDCGLTGHFGYGFFEILCLPDIIDIGDPACINTTTTISTIIDTSNINLVWKVKNPNQEIPVEIENLSDPSSFEITFDMYGTYTVYLEVPYFTTTTECDNTISVFEKTFIVGNCIPCDDCTSFDLVHDTKYLVSGWVKEEKEGSPHYQFKNYEQSTISILFKDILTQPLPASEVTFYPSGAIIDGWQRIVGEFTVPSDAEFIQINLNNISDGTDSYFDDIRILPSKANMKSFVYDQKTQKLMAELDENNYSTFYEYDNEGGLIRIKKETERGVYTIQETRSSNPKKD